MTLNENSICPTCKIHPLGRFNFNGKPVGEVREICIRCSNAKSRVADLLKNKVKTDKIPKKICECCQISFAPFTYRQHFCSTACTERAKIIEKNEKWKKKELYECS